MPPRRKKKKAKRRAAPRVQPERVCSAGLAALLGVRNCTMGDAVKRLWAHAKGTGLQEGASIRCDAAMRRLFGVHKLEMTEVFGALSKHMQGAGAAAASSGSGGGGIGAAGSSSGGGSSQGRGAALVESTRDEGPVLVMTAQLASLLGAGASARMTMAEALRKLGAYCSRHKLRDATDRRKVHCDNALARVLLCDSFTVYEAKALLRQHMQREPLPEVKIFSERMHLPACPPVISRVVGWGGGRRCHLNQISKS